MAPSPQTRQDGQQGHDRPLKQGTVTSNKMAKTIVVEVERLVQHALYGKFQRKSTKLYAHDEKGEASIGESFGSPSMIVIFRLRAASSRICRE